MCTGRLTLITRTRTASKENYGSERKKMLTLTSCFNFFSLKLDIIYPYRFKINSSYIKDLMLNAPFEAILVVMRFFRIIFQNIVCWKQKASEKKNKAVR